MSNSIDSYVDGALHRLTQPRSDASPAHPGARAAAEPPRDSGDLLDLTGRARTLKALEQDLAGVPEVDAARVRELKQAVDAGHYRMDAERVAEKLLALDRELP